MSMERILLIGCGGSGKSTLARSLGQRFQLPVMHLDQLFWQSGWVNISNELFDERLQAVLEQPRWVIDGDYARTLPLRLRYCDTVIYLDYPRAVCLWGVTRRVHRHQGRTRTDMAPGCPERVDAAFMRWVWRYPKDKRPQNLRLLVEAAKSNVTVLRFRTRHACRQWLNALPTQAEPVLQPK